MSYRPIQGFLTPNGRRLRGPSRSATLIPVPARPPTGYYDPSIDSQVSAGARGLQDLGIDTATGIRRGGENLQTTLADLLTGENRARADYGTATENLSRNYGILGARQAEATRAHGILSQDLMARADAIRSANQGREQGQLDTSLARSLQDIGTARTAAQTNYDRTYGPGGDLNLTLARAMREQPILESDANQQRLYQAKAAGYIPPNGPQWLLGPVRYPRRARVGNGRGVG